MKAPSLKYLLLPLLFLFSGGLFSSAHSTPEEKVLFQGAEEEFGILLHQKGDPAFDEHRPEFTSKASFPQKEDEKEEGEWLSFLFEQEDDDKVKHPFKLNEPRNAYRKLFTDRRAAPKKLLAVHPPKTSSQRWHLILRILRE